MPPDLLVRVKGHKAELLAAVADGLERSDVQVGYERPPVALALGERDEKSPLPQGDRLRVTNDIGVPAGEANAERLEGITAEKFSDFVRVHTPILPARSGVHNGPTAYADREARLFLAAAVPSPDRTGR
jgi:hypothetical protein